MMRGKTWTAPMVALGVLAAACAGLGNNQSKRSATPDPAGAVVLSVPNGAIYLIDPATGAQSRIVSRLGDFRDGYAAWAPGHQRLAYGNHGVYLLDLSHHRTELIVGEVGMSMPAWSPSGQVLAYGDGSSLWITPLTELRPLQIHVPATLAPLGMDWSTTGIAFQGIHRDCNGSYLCPTTQNSDIWTIQADGTDLRQVTRNHRASSPKWSPDGSTILFIRRIADDLQELWMVDADGSHPRQVGTAEDVVAADWAPDGTRIALVRRGLEGATIRVWIVDANGINLQPVGGMVPGKEATVDW
jgi:Tol biopolymer transport system component